MKSYFVLTFLSSTDIKKVKNETQDIPKVDETIVVDSKEYRVFHITTNYDEHVKYIMCKPEGSY